ncbi:MAG: phage portal protein [Dehalococcoidia bacterium]|nr:phage portal protein [Dehalococcoidia bacterium]
MPFDPAVLPRLDQDRMRRYTEHLDLYNGLQWPGPSTRRQERRLTFNYIKTAIDKVTSYLMGSLNFAVDPLEDTDPARDKARAAEKAIYQVYEANNLSALDFQTEIDAAILGDGCYKVTWDPEEKQVRVTAPDPQGLFAWWRGDDPSRIWRIASRYTLTAEEVEALHQVKPTRDKAVLAEVWTPATFELFIDNASQGEKPNPYGFIPFVLFPNLQEPKKFWGMSDIPPITETQKELNRALSQLSRILEVSGNPIAVLENVESSEDIAVQPNAVWNIPEGAKAYLLDLLQGGGVRLHVDYIDLLYRTLHDLAEAPRAAFGGIERELSGVALEIELHPLLQKVKRKRTLRSAAYKRRNEMTLALLGQYTSQEFGPVSHRIVWGAVLPQDTQRQAQNEQLLVQTGIHSRQLAMDNLGIQDPEKEFGRWMEERKRILEMNQALRARSTRGGDRERAVAPEAEAVE